MWLSFGNKTMKTHDYTQRYWGHDFSMYNPLDSEGLTATLLGFGRGISVDDYMIFSQTDGNTTRYQVTKIDYYRDPPDMWKMWIKFAPRTPIYEPNDD